MNLIFQLHFFLTPIRKFNEIQNQLGLKKKSLVQLSETRWSCRFKSCSSIIQNYSVLIEFLKEEIDVQKNKDVAEAIEEVLKIIHILSNHLQSKSATLGNSKCLIDGVITTLQQYRDFEQHYDKLWNEMLEFSTKHEISLEIPLQSVFRKRLRKESSQLKDFVCSSTTSSSDDHIVETKKEYWKKKAYYCILDTIINILKIRFSEESLQVASSVDSLLKLNFEGSSFLVDHHKDLFGIADQSLKSEMSVLRNILGENPSLEQIKQHLALYDGKVFSNFSKMFQVAITLPVSTATCERSFSTIRRIKTWLRTCMSQDRLVI
ncbi:hypothetical protein AGLY_000602 [Aphis glycines]|uniref:HAT C-terminal dimerisation domain-containing protein n=1 Tax=Aphis glycines TaxID=307491 RepID=A0A6G0U8X5_APHGL|nr:hypothetical protein AGLY_000602 [Aphis glycines]